MNIQCNLTKNKDKQIKTHIKCLTSTSCFILIFSFFRHRHCCSVSALSRRRVSRRSVSTCFGNDMICLHEAKNNSVLFFVLPDPISQSYPQLCSRTPMAAFLAPLLPSPVDSTDLSLPTSLPQLLPFA